LQKKKRKILGVCVKTVVGSGNFNYERERDFVLFWGCDGRFAKETVRDTGFEFLRDFVNCSAQKNARWQISNLLCI